MTTHECQANTKRPDEEYTRAVCSLRDKISSFAIAIFDCLERLEYLEIERGMSSGFDIDSNFMGAVRDSRDAWNRLDEAISRKYSDIRRPQ